MPNAPGTLIPHGTLDYSEMRALGLQPDDLTLFSSNVNPFGPPPAVLTVLQEAITPEMIGRYPDRLNLELIELLAAYHNLPATCILAGNGTADLLWLIGLLYLQHTRVAILGPTFGEYRNVAAIMQAAVVEICHTGWMATPEGFQPGATTITHVVTELHKANPDVVFVCNPNNPTGQYLTPDELAILYNAAPNALWIIDEAYAEFMQPPATTADWVGRGNWLILRSMTKDFALGGLRLGYLLAAPNLITSLQAAQSPWNVNTFAQLAGSVSLREGQRWRSETLTRLHRETESLRAALAEAGYHPHPTNVNYFLLPVHSPSTVRAQLLTQRLVVRDCTSFGLPNFIRIATQQPEANAHLIQALSDLAPAHAAPGQK
jgi:histidinol-phosphate aminotransferase